MAKAIFTVTDENELAGIPSKHPVRSIQNGDIAILSGGVKNDDNIVFTAQLSSNPLTSMPDTLASDDNYVQWNTQARSFNDGGIPTSLEHRVAPISPMPDGWELYKEEPYQFKPSHILQTGIGNYCEALMIDTDFWILSASFGIYDTTNKNAYTNGALPVLPGESGGLQDQGKCYCIQDSLIHIVGGYATSSTAHHTYDPTTQTFSASSKAALPAAQYGGRLVDTTSINGKIYFFGKSGSYNIYSYDVTEDTWDDLGTSPVSSYVIGYMVDTSTNSILLIYSNGDIYRFLVNTESFEYKNHNTKTSAKYQALHYDEIEEVYYWWDIDDRIIYDPVLNTVSYEEGHISYIFDAYCSAHLGNGYYLLAYNFEYYIFYLFALRKSIYLRKAQS